MKINKWIKFILLSFFVVNASWALGGNDVLLLVAAAEGKLDDVKMHLKEKADINNQAGSYGMTALHYALLNNKCDVVVHLLEQGAKSDIKGGFDDITADELITVKKYCNDAATLNALGNQKKIPTA